MVDEDNGQTNPRILIVEDELVIAEDLGHSLRSLGYEVVGMAASSDEVLRIVEREKPDLVLMDIKLSGPVDGIEVADRIRMRLDIPVVYLTGYAEKDVLDRAKRTEPYGYLGKPSTLLEVRSTIDTALYKHRTDQRLKESESKYRLLVETMGNGLGIRDENGIITYVNDNLCKMWGYARDEIVGRSAADFFDQSAENILQHQMQSRRLGEEGHYELDWKRKDGSTIHTIMAAKPIFDTEGIFKGSFAVITDITERIKTEKALRQSEQRYRALFEQSPHAIAVVTEDGTLMTVNEAFCILTGYRREEALSIKAQQLWADERARSLWQEEMARNGSVQDHPMEFRRKDGEIRQGLISSSIIRAGDGSISYQSLVREVTDREKWEESLRIEKTKFETLSESAPFGMLMIARDGTFTYANPKFKEIFGYDLSEIPDGRTWFRKVYPDSAYRHEVVRDWIEDVKVAKVGEQRPRSYWVRCKDGAQKIVAFSPVQLETGDHLMTCEDVTESELLHNALEQSHVELGWSEAEKRAILDAIDDLVVYQDSAGKIVWANRVAGESVGESPSRLHGKHCYQVWHGRSARCNGCPVEQAFATGMATEGETTSPDGRVWLIKGYPVRGLDDRMVGAVEVATDITERRQTEHALRQSEERFRSLVEHLNVGVFAVNPDGAFLHANQMLAKMAGFESVEDLMETPVQQLFPDAADQKRLRRELSENGSLRDFEVRVARRDGTIHWVTLSAILQREGTGKTAEILGIVIDVTERKLAEEQLRASLKEKEILLREVQHRVKNNLAVMNSLLNLQARLHRDGPLLQVLAGIQARIRSMIVAHELLYQSNNLVHLNMRKYLGALIDHLVVSMESLLKSISISKEIQNVAFSLDQALPLGFILTELVTNALEHAFPGRTEGEIRVVFRSTDDDRMELVVADNGAGMPEDIDVQGSASMGMSLVAIFARQLGGVVEVNRADGTEVRIMFRAPEDRKP